MEFSPKSFPLPFIARHSLARRTVNFRTNADEQFFKSRWIIVQKLFERRQNRLAALFPVSFACFLWSKDDGVVGSDGQGRNRMRGIGWRSCSVGTIKTKGETVSFALV